jgi:divalent metal cation (Fe/Co/Zn/Cd) transporter
MEHQSLKKRALLLSYLTVGYNIIEGVVSLLAGCLAGSIALVSVILMPLLFFQKLRTSVDLGSRSLRADAKQNLACAFLSLALLVGLGLNYVAGLWQADPVIGLIIGAVLVREGYETLTEEKLCSCCGVSCEGQGEE